MKEDILDAAEKRIRTTGYHGFSFRDIAQDVGIKSSSVHYHFPTKSDLVVATTQRYGERFLLALGNPDDDRTPSDKIEALRAAFRHAMTHDQLMCLCGVLASEVSSVPAEVTMPVVAFFEHIRDWLEVVVADKALALQIIATLEGALLMARMFDDVKVFDDATSFITH